MTGDYGSGEGQTTVMSDLDYGSGEGPTTVMSDRGLREWRSDHSDERQGITGVEKVRPQ